MRVAAVDVGTNSVHLLVAEVSSDGEVRPIDAARHQVELGSGGLDAHQLTPAAFDRGVEALTKIAETARRFEVDDITAVATSAVREAANGPQFVRAVKEAAGIHLRVIPGTEEARLVYLGVRSALDLTKGPALLVDIGGGSTEFILADGDGPKTVASLHLGHIRLAERFHRDDPITPDGRQALKRHIKAEIAPLIARLPPGCFGSFIGTSGTARAATRMANALAGRALPKHDEGHVTTRKAIDRLLEELAQRPRAAFDEIPAFDPRRRATLFAGVTLLREIMKATGAIELTTSERSLREGLIEDWIRQHRPELEISRTIQTPRERTVELTLRRFGADRLHAEQVAQLAERLFDGTARLHDLGASDRLLLREAALLHDIGHHISGEDHPKHAQYLLKHIPLLGFTTPEVAVLANVVRYHSRSVPRSKHTDFAALTTTDQRRVRILAGLLRIADGLDRSHSQPISDLRIETARGTVQIRALAHLDADLEQWEVDQRVDLLADVLGRPVTVVVQPEDVRG